VTTIAEPARGARPSRVRGALLVLGLALLWAQHPGPWGVLWLAIPAATAASLLAAWRFGRLGLVVPAALGAGALALAGPASLWAWWVPIAGLVGAWMGLREEGGGPAAGVRAWMLAPLLALAATLPWAPGYRTLVSGLEGELAAAEAAAPQFWRQLGTGAEQIAALERQIEEQAKVRERALPNVVPTLLFVWTALLVAAGRALSARAAWSLRWPPLSRAPFRDWRLPDAALWVFLAGLALLVAGWPSWAPTGWTLLLNAGLGFCVQGIAVVESLLLARGVPPSIIILTLLFVFTVALPAFLLTTAALGLSDVWLDFRRLEPVADDDGA
jgi:hypothetical protein